LTEVNDISSDGLAFVGRAISPIGADVPYIVYLDRPLNIPEPPALGLFLILAASAIPFLATRRRR